MNFRTLGFITGHMAETLLLVIIAVSLGEVEWSKWRVAGCVVLAFLYFWLLCFRSAYREKHDASSKG